MRVELSRKVVETLTRLDDPELKPKEVAQTLLALKAVASESEPERNRQPTASLKASLRHWRKSSSEVWERRRRPRRLIPLLGL